MLKRTYLISFIFSIALALSAYVSSSFVSDHLGESAVGVLYTASALLALLLLETLPPLICQIGNRYTTILLLGANLIGLSALILGTNPVVLGIAFTVFQTSITLIAFCLDIFVEHFSKDAAVGSVRGTYLSLSNLAWVFAPIAAGFFVSTLGYSTLFSVVLGCVGIATILTFIFYREYKDSICKRVPWRKTFLYIAEHRDIAHIIAINFILQFFFAWMVIYAPIYLNQTFSFTTIGWMFAIMLSAFVIFEYPIGRLADHISPKKLITLGMLILGTATLVFATTPLTTALTIAGILFATRVGAAMVEVLSETYFFKRVSSAETEIISLFRAARPLAFAIAPITGTMVISQTSHQTLFMLLGIGILVSLVLVIKLHDEK